MAMDSHRKERDRGSRRAFPRHRRMAIDIAHAALTVPSFPVHRVMKLGAVDQARKRFPTRIGWAALLCYAYSEISQEIPELREVYVEKPFEYLYRHPNPVASITIQRTDEQGNERLVWGRIAESQCSTIGQTQETISRFTTSPLSDFFRDGLKMENRPKLLRRITWWILMRWSGRRRAKHLGTFSISNLGGWGALNAHHPLVTSTSLSMGPIQANGDCELVLLCDHRVLDGALAAQVVDLLEHRLRSTVLQALQSTDMPLLAA
jgi:hypothetical protein